MATPPAGRLVAYVQPHRTVGRVTGVGKFVARAPWQLARAGWDVRLLCAHDSSFDQSPLAGLPTIVAPWSARALEWGGALIGRPRVDSWVAGADWLWNPADSFVAARSVRLAVTAHTSDWLEPDLPWASERRYRRIRCRWRLYYRAVRRARARVLTVSDFLRGRLIDCLGLPPGEVRTVGHGVDAEFFAAADRSPPEAVRAAQPYVLIAGGLTRYKGGDRALAVADLLPQCSFVAIDDRPADRPLPGNVRSLGYCSVADGLADWYAGASAVLVLSRYETFGLCAAEALAAGTPVFVSAAGALPEVVADPRCIVNADDPGLVADRLRGVLANPAERVAMIAAGRARAEEYRWPQTARRIALALDN